MNKKLLLIWTFLLCFVMGMSAVEKTAVITFKDNGGTKDNTNSTTAQADLIAEGGSLISNFTASGKIFQAQKDYGIKFGNSSGGGNITMTLVNTYKPTKIIANVSGYSNTENSFTINGTEITGIAKKPTFEDKEVVYDGNTTVSEITITTAKRGFIKSITIVYDEDGEDQTTAAPTIEGTTPFFGTTTVTLGCTTTGAKIYYTLDGNDPTKESTEYAEPFTLDKTATVKAVAYNGDAASTVTTKEFVLAPTVATVAELTALAKGDVFQYSGELTVVAAPTAKYLYVKDAEGKTTLLYDAAGGFAFEAGQHIAAGWQGKVDVYSGLFEAVPTTELTAVADVKDEITYDTKTAADVTVDNANTVAWLKGVAYTAPADGKKNFTITEGETEIAGYNQFGIEIAAPAEGRTYDILGVISRYNDNAQFQPISITAVPQVVAVEVAAETGADLAALVDAKVAEITAAGDKAGNVVITLAKDGAYTVSKTIETNGNISIIGDAEGIATVDASALTAPFVQIATPVAEADANGFFPIGDVVFKNVKVTGLAAQLFYANKQKVLIDNFVFNNSIAQVNGGSKTVFDTNGGGVIAKLDIQNSTIYANPQNTGALYSSQSGQKATEAGLEMQTISIQNSTLYNIAYNKNVNNHRQSNQKWLTYVVKNNIVLDCGKDGQFVKGLNQGQGGANPVWDVDNNSFLRTVEGVVEDHGAMETTGDADEEVKNNVEGVTTFADLANGDFTVAASSRQAKFKVGDPRWLVDFVAEDVTAAKAELAAEIQKATEQLGDADVENDEAAKTFKEAIDKAQATHDTAEFNDELNKALDELKAAEAVYAVAKAKAELAAEVKAATELLGDADVENNEDAKTFKAAIDKAQTVCDNADATVEEIQTALQELKAAEEAYNVTLAVESVNAEKNAADGAWYTIQGVRVATPSKGVFIHNGKKVVMK